MKIFDVIYYQTFLFYSKRLKEEDPHFTTTWGVGVAFAFIITFPLFTIIQSVLCIKIKTLIMFLIAMLITFLLFMYFKNDNKREIIIKNKPLFRNSKNLSKIIAIGYFIIAISFLFIFPILGSYYIKIFCK